MIHQNPIRLRTSQWKCGTGQRPARLPLRNQEQDKVRQLAAGMAHDLNNLLTSVLCGSSLALDQLGKDHPARSTIEIVSQSGEEAAALVRQLMAYSGIAPFVATRLNVSELVSDIAGSLRASVPDRVRLRFDLARSLPLVRADAGQMEHLVRALVDNAAESIDGESAGTISIRTRAVSIGGPAELPGTGPGSLDAGDYVQLEVTDTGQGMDEALAGRMFEPFFSTKSLGRGLGLAAGAGIVRAHRGAIRAETAPGLGSAFRVYLPGLAPESLLLAENRAAEEQRVEAAA